MSDTPITPELLSTWQALADTVQPCPICKQPPGMTTTGPSIDRGRSQVSCGNCRFETPVFDSPGDAMRHWNASVENHPIARRIRQQAERLVALEAENARLVAALSRAFDVVGAVQTFIDATSMMDLSISNPLAIDDYIELNSQLSACNGWIAQYGNPLAPEAARAALAHVTSETQP